MNKLIIASSSDLRKIIVKDNYEKLVDLRNYCSHLVFKIARYIEKMVAVQLLKMLIMFEKALLID